MEKRRIVLYGNSIIVGSIGASLKLSYQFEVIHLLSAQQNELEALEPDAVLFDLEAPHPESAFNMLEKRPDMTLIGVSPDTNVVRAWFGRQLRELSTKDLIEVIDHS